MATDNMLDKAGAILASRGIINELDSMIKKLGKLNTDHILKISTGVSTLFGIESGEEFVNISSQAINSAISAVQQSKQQINAELTKLQNIMDGVTDLSSNVGVEPAKKENTQKSQPTAISDTDMDAVFDDNVGTVSAKTAMNKKTIDDADIDDALGSTPKKESRTIIKTKALTIMEASIKKKLNESIESTVMGIIGPLIAAGAESMNIDDLATKVNAVIPGLYVDRTLLMQLLNPEGKDGTITQITGDSIYFGKTTEPLEKSSKSKSEKDAQATAKAASDAGLDELIANQKPVYSKLSGTDLAGMKRSF